MRVALLCPGPSLITHDQRSWRGKLRMGVNSAAVMFRLDYWAGLDKTAFELWGPDLIQRYGKRGWKLPRMLIQDQDHADLMGDATLGPLFTRLADRGGALKISELRDSFVAHPPLSFPDFSVTAALVWCVRLGADEVDIYGADMRGTKDYRGWKVRAAMSSAGNRNVRFSRRQSNGSGGAVLTSSNIPVDNHRRATARAARTSTGLVFFQLKPRTSAASSPSRFLRSSRRARPSLAGTVVDDSTLVPLGLLVLAIVTTSTVVWKVAGLAFSTRQQLASMKRKLAKVMKRLNLEDDDDAPEEPEK